MTNHLSSLSHPLGTPQIISKQISGIILFSLDSVSVGVCQKDKDGWEVLTSIPFSHLKKNKIKIRNPNSSNSQSAFSVPWIVIYTQDGFTEMLCAPITRHRLLVVSLFFWGVISHLWVAPGSTYSQRGYKNGTLEWNWNWQYQWPDPSQNTNWDLNPSAGTRTQAKPRLGFEPRVVFVCLFSSFVFCLFRAGPAASGCRFYPWPSIVGYGSGTALGCIVDHMWGLDLFPGPGTPKKIKRHNYSHQILFLLCIMAY